MMSEKESMISEEETIVAEGMTVIEIQTSMAEEESMMTKCKIKPEREGVTEGEGATDCCEKGEK